jgi:hypothetical protein
MNRLTGYELYKFWNEKAPNKQLTRKASYFKKIGYKPWKPTQDAFHNSNARFRVWHAGVKSGKSLASARDMEPIILYGGTKGWIISSIYELGQYEFHYILESFQNQGFAFENLSDSPKTGKMYFRIEGVNGISSVEVKSGKDITKLGGESLDWVLMVEAATMDKDVWERNIRQRLADKIGIAAFTTTPKGRNWTYKLHKRGLNKNKADWESFYCESISNPHLDKKEINNAKEDLSQDAFNQEYRAHFLTFAGRIYKNFDSQLNYTSMEYTKDLPLYVTFDFGYQTPSVCLFIQIKDEKFYVVDEIYRTHLTHSEFGDYVREYINLNEYKKEDGAYGDISKPEAIAEMKKHDFYIRGRQTDINLGIELVRQILKPGARKLFVNTIKCPHFTEEMENYQYKKTATLKEIPADIDNHGCDAIREFIVNFKIGKPNIRMV